MKYKINIPEPCHQDWSEMSPNEQGRFCTACSKTVIDFSGMSSREILDHISASSGEACGRFAKHQLGQKELVQPKPWAKYLAAAGIIATIGTTKLAAQEKMCKIKLSPIENYLNEEGEYTKPTLKAPVQSSFIFKGRVVSKDEKTPLEGAAVWVSGSDRGSFTDEEGYFSLDLTDFAEQEEIKLIIRYIGYETQEAIVSREQSQGQYELFTIPLEDHFVTMGVVVVSPRNPIRYTAYQFRRLGYGVRRLFRR